MDRRTALLRALPILLFTVLFGVLIVFLALRTAGGVRRSEDIVEAYGPVIPACDGEPVPAAPLYDLTQASHPVVALRRAGMDWAPDPGVLPAAWQPAAPEQAELALCLEASLPLSAPPCEGEQEETRTYGYATTVRLVARATGQEVTHTILNSAPDPGCWRTEPEAAPLSNAQVQDWLAPFVRPPSGG